MSRQTVVYDACVLYPAALRDFLMRLAIEGVCSARWTARIHDEWTRNVLANLPDVRPAGLRRTRDLMDAHVLDCLVEGYEPLIETLTLPDPDDRHVLAAAVTAGRDGDHHRQPEALSGRGHRPFRHPGRTAGRICGRRMFVDDAAAVRRRSPISGAGCGGRPRRLRSCWPTSNDAGCGHGRVAPALRGRAVTNRSGRTDFGPPHGRRRRTAGATTTAMDKIWWNELYMGWPVGPWYAEQSNVTNAKDVTGSLLLIVGETDHNVDPASTMQVVNALVKADRDFDLLVIPNADHGQDGRTATAGGRTSSSATCSASSRGGGEQNGSARADQSRRRTAVGTHVKWV